jgi:RsmE family RNA methyltransferase
VNLILLEPEELQPDGTARITGPRATHVRTVLKSAPGHALRVGLIDGPLGTATITAVGAADADPRHDVVDLACILSEPVPARPPVDLLLALPRPKVMRRLWAQLAAIGVGRVILTNAEKVERDYFDTHILTPATYRPLLVEGLQEARDTRLPVVTIHKRFRVLIEDELDALCPSPAHRLVAHPQEMTPGVVSWGFRPETTPGVILAIGPEGGWNDFELGLLEARGFQRISLGPRSLRTDTACIAMLSLVHKMIRQ